MAVRQMCKKCFFVFSRSTTWKAAYPTAALNTAIPPRPPDYDVDGSGDLNEGERLFESPKPKLTGVEESTAEWKFVEKILPPTSVPPPPKHDKYPTPSGWMPATASPADNPYYVRRTRFHNFPLYYEIHDGGSRKLTLVRRVEGDLWTFDAELRAYLEKRTGKRMHTQVDEITGKLRVRGTYLDEVSEFLIEKGF